MSESGKGMSGVVGISRNGSGAGTFPDSSLTTERGRRRTGYGIVGYNKGLEIFRGGEALGEHVEVFDTEMAGLHTAVIGARNYLKDNVDATSPNKIIFYADNSSAIRQIFEGSEGKAQAHSRGFRRTIREILDEFPDTKITISWCPGHCGIPGNEEADKTAKLASSHVPRNPNYKSQEIGRAHV